MGLNEGMVSVFSSIRTRLDRDITKHHPHGKEARRVGILERIEALKAGRGVQYFVDSACTILNNPVYVLDAYYHLIAASDGPMDIPVWRDLVGSRTLSPSVIETLEKGGVFSVVSALAKPVYLQKREGWSGGSVMMKIVDRNDICVGTVSMYDYFSPIQEETLEAFNVLAEKISAEIQEYDYFTQIPMVFFTNTVRALLDKTTPATLLNQSQAQVIRNRLDAFLYVAVVQIARNDFPESVHQRRLMLFSSILKTQYPSVHYALYADYIVLLFDSSSSSIHEAQPLGEDDSFFTYNDLHVGVSSSFADIYDLGTYYEQALAALKQGLEAKDGSRVFLFGQ